MLDFRPSIFLRNNAEIIDVVGVRQTNYVVSTFGRKLPNGPRRLKSCVNYGLPWLDYYDVWATENNEAQIFYSVPRATPLVAGTFSTVSAKRAETNTISDIPTLAAHYQSFVRKLLQSYGKWRRFKF